jgi:hypothetical protein
MRLILPVLLLTATGAMAQSQPTPADKPFVYDGPSPKGFTAPAPVVIVTAPGQETVVTPPARSGTPKAGTTDKPDLEKPQAPKPAPKDVA